MTMLAVFGALRGVVKTNAPGEVHLASAWSGLHHRLTTVLLLFLMLLVSARQYLGEPVQCIQQKEDAGVPESVMNTYCFIATTYTVVRPRQPAHLSAAEVRRQLPWGLAGSLQGAAVHPGLQGLLQGLGADPALDEHVADVPDAQGATIRRHAYYQWVPLVLGLQAMLFFAPYAAWTLWEGGLVAGAVAGLRLQELLPAEQRRGRARLLARYFHGTLNSHLTWAAGYWAAELLNLLNVVANALLLDALLGGRFLRYGADVLSAAAPTPAPPLHPQLLHRLHRLQQRLDPYPDYPEALGLRPEDPADHPEDPADPMEAVFPKLTKCTFFKYGPSGSIQRHDALCVMALNVVNEKVFVLLWCWFAVLAAVSLLVVARTCLALAAYACAACARRSPGRNRLAPLALWLMLHLMGLPMLPADVAEALAARLDAGDWVFLLLLSKNMPRAVYRVLAAEIALLVRPKRVRGPDGPPPPPRRVSDAAVPPPRPPLAEHAELAEPAEHAEPGELEPLVVSTPNALIA